MLSGLKTYTVCCIEGFCLPSLVKMKKLLFILMFATPAYGQLSIATTSVPSGTQYQSYSTTISAHGGTPPYSFSVDTSGTYAPLPEGMALNPSTGVISSPQIGGQGQYIVGLVVTDSALPTHATGEKALTFSIAGSNSFMAGVFPSTSIFYHRVDAATTGLPVDTSPAAPIPSYYVNAPLHLAFGNACTGNFPCGIPAFQVPYNQSDVSVATIMFQSYFTSGPIPGNAPIEGTIYGTYPSGDGHVLIYQNAGGGNPPALWEMWQGVPENSGAWQDSSNALWSNTTTNNLTPQGMGTTDAAGLPVMPLLENADEVIGTGTPTSPNGVPKHPIRFTLNHILNYWVWPATETAGIGVCTDPTGNYIPVEAEISQASPPTTCSFGGPAGEIYRLKASVSTPACASTSPQANIIITQLRNYGLIIADNGGSGYIIGTPDSRWNDNDLACLTNLKLSEFEPVNVSSLRVSEDSGATTPASNAVSATATFTGFDSGTEGNWIGKYGSGGYSLATAGASIPSYASFTVQNQLNYTWASPTTDVRALETGGGSARIAATWYSGSSFNFSVNFTDGNSHQLGLYALDWDDRGRSESIVIRDANTNAILDTETVSGFTGGTYLEWNISGSVNVSVTPLTGPNAVISGVFFGGGAASGTVPAPSSVATFSGFDNGTEGSWIGKYGAAGYSLANSGNSIPSYASFTVQNQLNYTWAASTADVRAIETGSGLVRIAATWYSGSSFSFNLNFTDGNSHQFALYALDWDYGGRSETIQITDAATGAVLDKETVSGFTGGTYLVWNISGNVNISVTSIAGSNAVISGVFFGGGAVSSTAPSSVATFSGFDSGTGGSWLGKYGAAGYSVANAGASIPSYASFSVQNQLNYTWVSSTADVRALETGSGLGRIAATWYSGSSFSFNVNFTDGNSHQFALYALDWDYGGRSETIQITDAATGAVLDKETVSGFTGGTYLVWNISGNVNISVTSITGPNAVVSGAFFN